jgi:3-deoxy-7-phosphoheptulonate synthase
MSPGAGRILVLDLETELPAAGLEALQQQLGAAGLAGRLVEAGWCRLLRVPLPAGSPEPAPSAWRLAGVRRAFVQEDGSLLAARSWREADSVIAARGHRLGGGAWQLIAGPCSVEDRVQMREVAHAAAEAGAGWLRGGAFKPRSSPYHFQGLGAPALELLREAADERGLAVITELLDLRDLPLLAACSDVLQVGSRNSQNLPLLKELGRCGRPVLLKRGFGCTLEETVLAAEYVLCHGNPQVAICERGIRSFEPAMRFTFDLGAMPWLKQHVHLPVVADPSHATGDARLVPAVARGALAAGADGIMVEIHPRPDRSISDPDQALSLEAFGRLAAELRALAAALGRSGGEGSA